MLTQTKRTFAVAAVLVCTLAFGASAHASTVFYVSPTGSDSNPGTHDKPWRTIGKAFATLTSGQTAFVRAGTYEEKLGTTCDSKFNRLTWTRSGTATAPITVSGYPGEESRVVVKTHISMKGNYTRLRNLVVDRNRSYSSFDLTCTGSTGLGIWGDYNTIDGVEVRNASMSGIYLEGADYVKVLRSRIHRNGSHYNLDHGIYFKSGVGGLLANNLFEHNYAHGIKLGPGPSGTVVSQNTVVRNGAGGKGSGIMIGGDSSLVANNVRVVNNLSVANKEFGVRSYWEASVGTGNIVDRNLLHGNGSGASWYPKGGVTETGSIFHSPAFVDLVAGDYRLMSSSPAIGVARTTFSYNPDFHRKTRDTAPDLGSIEH